MAPACDLLHQGFRDELLAEEKGEDFALEELGQEAVLKGSDMMKLAFGVLPSFGHQEVGMGMEINFLSRPAQTLTLSCFRFPEETRTPIILAHA